MQIHVHVWLWSTLLFFGIFFLPPALRLEFDVQATVGEVLLLTLGFQFWRVVMRVALLISTLKQISLLALTTRRR